MNNLNYISCLAVLGVFFYCISPSLASLEKGPLHARNHFPPHLMFLKPMPDSPLPAPPHHLKMTLDIDYSSVFLDEHSAEWDVLIDLEMTVVTISLEYGLTEWSSMSLEMPFVSMSDGFLDSFLETYHTTFQFPNYGREKRPKNDFAYSIKKNGQEWFTPEVGDYHSADSILAFKVHGPSTSFSYRLKIPTGDEKRGVGSGHSDHGFFLSTKFSLPPLSIYVNPSLILLSDPKTLGPDISVKNIFGLFGGAEYIFNKSWSALSQLNYYTSPFENTHINQLDTDSLEITFGLIYSAGSDMNLEFGFSEDLFKAAPDFTLHCELNYRFSPSVFMDQQLNK
ncbi:MAG: DUF3187 family protein [bacterium]